MPTQLRWQLQRLESLILGGLRSISQRGLMATLLHIPRRMGWSGRSASHVIPVGQPVVLIVDAQVPDPTRDSGSVRLLAICDLLRARGLAVAFVPDSGTADQQERQRMYQAGIAVVGTHGGQSLPTWLKQRQADVHAVLLCRHTVASNHLELVRHLLPSARVAFDTVDLHYLREQRAAQQSGDVAALAAADQTRKAELDLVARCDLTYVVSSVEAQVLGQACPQAHIQVLSNIHELQPEGPGPEKRQGALFVGGWSHHPNQDAVAWLTESIWPQVQERSPGYLLHLVGDMPPAMLEKCNALPGIRAHGRVADLQPLMENCRVALAPLRVGAGVKGKINSAMSHGLPVIATSIAAEGMFISDGVDALIADHAPAFAEAIVRLQHDDSLWTKLSAGGRENVQRHFSAQAADAALQALLLPLPRGPA